MCILLISHLYSTKNTVKNPPANAGDIRDVSLTSGSGRSPRGGNGNPLQYCLENPKDREAWRATAQGLQRVGHN